MKHPKVSQQQYNVVTGLEGDIADPEESTVNISSNPGGTHDATTGGNSNEKICVDDVVKLIEDLARLH